MQDFERELLELLPRLRRFARSLARDATDADDLVQLSLERALRARAQWQQGTKLDAWIMKILRNCWIDEIRCRTRRAGAFSDGADINMIPDTAAAPDTLLDVGRAMNELPPQQREVIALVLVEGLAYREAADILEIPIGTVMSRLARGRKELAQKLEAV